LPLDGFKSLNPDGILHHDQGGIIAGGRLFQIHLARGLRRLVQSCETVHWKMMNTPFVDFDEKGEEKDRGLLLLRIFTKMTVSWRVIGGSTLNIPYLGIAYIGQLYMEDVFPAEVITQYLENIRPAERWTSIYGLDEDIKNACDLVELVGAAYREDCSSTYHNFIALVDKILREDEEDSVSLEVKKKLQVSRLEDDIHISFEFELISLAAFIPSACTSFSYTRLVKRDLM
jgi:hypothetical protein